MTRTHLFDGPVDPERCVQSVRDETRWPSWHQCNRPRGHGPNGEYCKQHSPDAVAERRHKQEMLWKAQDMKRSIELRAFVMFSALIEIANGHNDPRTIAAEAIKGLEKP